MADWQTVRELVLRLPEVVESSETSFRLRGKLVAWMSPRYANYPGILIRLEKIGREELADRIEDARLYRAPERLARELLGAL